MKKRFVLFGLLAATISLGSVALFGNDNRTEKAEATSSNPVSGVFEKIESTNQLVAGDKVIFVSENGYALDDIWGNPGYFHCSRDGVAFSEEKEIVTLASSKATVFEVELGFTNGATDENSRSFKGTLNVVGQRKTNMYLAHNDRDYYGDNTFEYIGYFKDRDIAVAPEHNANSSWTITTENSITTVRNLATNNRLCYTHYYADRFVSNTEYAVNVYREFNVDEYSISVANQPTNKNYNFGDEINLSGLVINFNCHVPSKCGTFSYDTPEHRGYFNHQKYANGSGEVILNVKFLDKPFTVTINVTETYESAYKAGQMKDYRGTYAIFASNGGVALDSDGAGNSRVEESDGVLTAKNAAADREIRFRVERKGSNYHFKAYNDKYLSLDNNTMSVVTGSTPNILLDNTAGGLMIKNSSGKYLCYDFEREGSKYYLGEYNTSYKVILYKYDISSEDNDAMNEFVLNFANATNACDYNGVETEMEALEEAWEGFASEFNELNVDAQGILARTTYTHNAEEAGSLADIVDRYDYIYNKYNDANPEIADFMQRIYAKTMQNNYSASVIINPFTTSNGSVTTIVIAVVAISMVTLVGFALIKKKYN